MKLTLTIVSDDDVEECVDALVAQNFYVTRLASTGGCLRKGSTVILSGVEDDQLDQMIKVIRTHTDIHIQPPTSPLSKETVVNRAAVFVLGLEQLVRS